MKKMFITLCCIVTLLSLVPVGYCEISDVVELKSGQKLMGKILKESQDSIFVSYANGSIEAWVLRNKIIKIRKPTLEDFKASEAEKQEWEQEKIKIATFDPDKEAAMQHRYQDEMHSASVARTRVDAKEQKEQNIKNAIRRGEVCTGMTPADVIESKGNPVDKTINRKEEIWKFSNGGSVRFYDGEVQ